MAACHQPSSAALRLKSLTQWNQKLTGAPVDACPLRGPAARRSPCKSACNLCRTQKDSGTLAQAAHLMSGSGICWKS